MTPLPRGYLRPSMTIRLSLGRCVWTTALSPTSRSVARSSRPQRYWGRARFSKAVIGTTCTSYSTCRAVLISCTLVITCEPCQPRRYALAAVAATSIAIGSYQTPSFRARYSDILRSKRTLGWRCADVSLCILKGVGRIWTEAHCMPAYLRGRTCKRCGNEADGPVWQDDARHPRAGRRTAPGAARRGDAAAHS